MNHNPLSRRLIRSMSRFVLVIAFTSGGFAVANQFAVASPDPSSVAISDQGFGWDGQPMSGYQ
jgi:hypothetical protein